MTAIRNLVVTMWIVGLSFAFAQTAPPPRISAADSKKHVGDEAVVCGKVVDTKVAKYGLAGRGKPVNFDLDEPEPNPVFFFVAFGEGADGPKEAVSAYQGKAVCVTGKIALAGGVPYIMAGDRAQVKPQAAAK